MTDIELVQTTFCTIILMFIAYYMGLSRGYMKWSRESK